MLVYVAYMPKILSDHIQEQVILEGTSKHIKAGAILFTVAFLSLNYKLTGGNIGSCEGYINVALLVKKYMKLTTVAFIIILCFTIIKNNKAQYIHKINSVMYDMKIFVFLIKQLVIIQPDIINYK